MTKTDLQLGGGYIYQWECAVLLALNHFFEPVRYNPTLFDLVEDFLGQVAEIHLEGKDEESGVELEDIALVSGERRILIQVPEFHMAKYPVTNAQFKCFVDTGGYDEERYWAKSPRRAWPKPTCS